MDTSLKKLPKKYAFPIIQQSSIESTKNWNYKWKNLNYAPIPTGLLNKKILYVLLSSHRISIKTQNNNHITYMSNIALEKVFMIKSQAITKDQKNEMKAKPMEF